MSAQRIKIVLAFVTAGALAAACTLSRSPSSAPSAPVVSPSPTTAVAPQDYLLLVNGWELTGYEDVATWDPAVASLSGPSITIAFDAMTTVRSLTADQARPYYGAESAALVAAGGYEFVALHRAPQGALPITTSDRTGARVTIVAGEHRVEASAADLLDLGSLAGGIMIVSVPVSAPVSLVLEEAGRAQTLDLRGGRRGADAVAGYYPIRRTGADQGFDAWATSSLGAVQLRSPNGVSASLLPHNGDTWAAPGRLWLVVVARFVTVQPYSIFLDVGASFRINGSRPLANELVFFPATSGTLAETYLFLEMEVPASFTTATVTFSPRGTARANLSTPIVSLTTYAQSPRVVLTFPAV